MEEEPEKELEEIEKKREEITEGNREIEKKRLELESDIPWDKLSEFSEGVIAPLVRTSDEVKLFIRVQASSKKGIDENTLEIPIKETLIQINAENIKLETS